jgi:hypothetical protein
VVLVEIATQGERENGGYQEDVKLTRSATGWSERLGELGEVGIDGDQRRGRRCRLAQLGASQQASVGEEGACEVAVLQSFTSELRRPAILRTQTGGELGFRELSGKNESGRERKRIGVLGLLLAAARYL